MRERPSSPARRIRRSGLRVSLGSWTAYVVSSADKDCTLVVALGRSAGGAVTRSRARRIARDVFSRLCDKHGTRLLLLARENIRTQSRRSIRSMLQRLMTRAIQATTGPRPAEDEPRG